MTLMVALVGGQPLPNLLPIRHDHPKSVLFVYTTKTKKVCEQLIAILPKETKVYELETDAYDIPTIINALNAKLDTPELALQPMSINLTGGTKAMALAAYQIAQQRNVPVLYIESENKQNYAYRYTWENKWLKKQSKDLLTESVKLSDLFDVHLGIGNWKEQGPELISDGGIFESAVAETLRSHGYEVMIRVKTMKEQVEIDIAIRIGNQFGILEAKAGSGGRTLEGIKQLNNAIRHIGTFTKPFYIITLPAEPTHEVLREASGIKTIALSEYVSKSSTLSSVDSKKLLSAVDEVMKGQPRS